jgi:hypothetical protein
MPTTLEYALATAVAKAAMQGDAATARALLEACEANAGVDTFADASTKGGWSMKGLVNWLTGKKAAKKRHASEHEKQRAAFEVDDVQDAQTLTPTEQKIYDGELIHLASSNVHTMRYDRGDTRGGNTRLFLTFKDGSVYQYSDVPFSVVMDEYNTDSPGRGVWRWLREGTKPYKSKYNGRKIGEVSLTKKESKPTVIHILQMGRKK